MTIAALGIVWGLVRGNAAGWGSLEVIGSLAAGAHSRPCSCSGSYGRGSRCCRCGCSVARVRGRQRRRFLLFGALFSAVFFMAQFLQTALGQAPLDAGLRLLPWTGTVFIVAPIAGSLVDRMASARWSCAGC